jgi:integrase
MIRRRATPDGLPFRVYERFGVRVYSIGYKMRSGKWAFRYECAVEDAQQIQTLRRKAILESATVTDDRPIGGFAGLIDAWFTWQENLPANDARKRADSTIAENKREAAMLKKAWGHLEADEITREMGYEYLEACLTATDDKGNPRPRPEKGNKEMALACLILEFGMKPMGGKVVTENPLRRLERNRTVKSKRRVTAEEMALAVEMGRKFGGARHVVALALRTAWLCVRRSVEVRGIQRQAIREDGILWHDGKDPTKPAILIEWSDELRATVQEALQVKRSKVAGTMYLFGNQRGGRYTKGGWKAMLDDLMRECVKEAERRKMVFRKFSLQDCRPMGVSDKLEQGHGDVLEATGHTSEKMVKTVYDRREQKRAKPAA